MADQTTTCVPTLTKNLTTNGFYALAQDGQENEHQMRVPSCDLQPQPCHEFANSTL